MVGERSPDGPATRRPAPGSVSTPWEGETQNLSMQPLAAPGENDNRTARGTPAAT